MVKREYDFAGKEAIGALYKEIGNRFKKDDLVYVKSGSSGDGTKDRPFGTLQEALDFVSNKEKDYAITWNGTSSDDFIIDTSIITKTHTKEFVDFYVPKGKTAILKGYSAGDNNTTIRVKGEGSFDVNDISLSTLREGLNLDVDVDDDIRLSASLNITTNGSCSVSIKTKKDITYRNGGYTLFNVNSSNKDASMFKLFMSAKNIFIGNSNYQAILASSINSDITLKADTIAIEMPCFIDSSEASVKLTVDAGEFRHNNLLYNFSNNDSSELFVNAKKEIFSTTISMPIFYSSSSFGEAKAVFDVDEIIGGLSACFYQSQNGNDDIDIKVKCDSFTWHEESTRPLFEVTSGNFGKTNVDIDAKTIFSMPHGISIMRGVYAEPNSFKVSSDKIVIGSTDTSDTMFGGSVNVEMYANSIELGTEGKKMQMFYPISISNDEKYNSFLPSVTLKSNEIKFNEMYLMQTSSFVMDAERFEFNYSLEENFNIFSNKYLINVREFDLSGFNGTTSEYRDFIFSVNNWNIKGSWYKEQGITGNTNIASTLSIGRMIFPNLQTSSFSVFGVTMSQNYTDNDGDTIYVGNRLHASIDVLDYTKLSSMYGNNRYVAVTSNGYPGTNVSAVIGNVLLPKNSTIYPWDSRSATVNSASYSYNNSGDLKNRISTDIIFLDGNEPIPTYYVSGQGGSDSNSGLTPSNPLATGFAVVKALKGKNVQACKIKILTSEIGLLVDSSSDIKNWGNGVTFDFGEYCPQFVWIEGNGFTPINVISFRYALLSIEGVSHANCENCTPSFFNVNSVQSLTSLSYDSYESKYKPSVIRTDIANIETSPNSGGSTIDNSIPLSISGKGFGGILNMFFKATQHIKLEQPVGIVNTRALDYLYVYGAMNGDVFIDAKDLRLTDITAFGYNILKAKHSLTLNSVVNNVTPGSVMASGRYVEFHMPIGGSIKIDAQESCSLYNTITGDEDKTTSVDLSVTSKGTVSLYGGKYANSKMNFNSRFFYWQGITSCEYTSVSINADYANLSSASTQWTGYSSLIIKASSAQIASSHYFNGEGNSSREMMLVAIDAPLSGLSSSVLGSSGNSNFYSSMNNATLIANIGNINLSSSFNNVDFYITAQKQISMSAGYTNCNLYAQANFSSIGGGWNSCYSKIKANEVHFNGGGYNTSSFYVNSDTVNLYQGGFNYANIDSKFFNVYTNVLSGETRISSDIVNWYSSNDVSEGDITINTNKFVINSSPRLGTNSTSYIKDVHLSFSLHTDEVVCYGSAPIINIYAKPTFTDNGCVIDKMDLHLGSIDMSHANFKPGLSMTSPMIYIPSAYITCPINISTNSNEFYQQLKWIEQYTINQPIQLNITPDYGEFLDRSNIFDSFTGHREIVDLTSSKTPGKFIFFNEYNGADGEADFTLFDKMVVGNYYVIKAYGKTFGPLQCKQGTVGGLTTKYLGNGGITPYGSNYFIPVDFDAPRQEQNIFYGVFYNSQPGRRFMLNVEECKVNQQGYDWTVSDGNIYNDTIVVYSIGSRTSSGIFERYELDKIPAKWLWQPDAKQLDIDAPDFIKNMQTVYFGHGYALDGFNGEMSKWGNQLPSDGPAPNRWCKRFSHYKNIYNTGSVDGLSGIESILTPGTKVLVVIDGIPYVRKVYIDGGYTIIGNSCYGRFYTGNWRDANYQSATDDFCISISTDRIDYSFTTETTDREEKVVHEIRLFKLLDEKNDASEIANNPHVQEIWIDTKFAEEKFVDKIYVAYETTGSNSMLTSKDVNYSDGFDGLTPQTPVATLRRAVQLAEKYGKNCFVVPVSAYGNESLENKPVYIPKDVYLYDNEMRLYIPEGYQLQFQDASSPYSYPFVHDLIVRGKGNVELVSYAENYNIYIMGASWDIECKNVTIGGPSQSSGMWWRHQIDTAISIEPNDKEKIKIKAENVLFLRDFYCGFFGSNTNMHALDFDVDCNKCNFEIRNTSNAIRNFKLRADFVRRTNAENVSIFVEHADFDVKQWILGGEEVSGGYGIITFHHVYMPIESRPISYSYELLPSSIKIGNLIQSKVTDGQNYTDSASVNWKKMPLLSFYNTQYYGGVSGKWIIDIVSYDLSRMTASDYNSNKYCPLYQNTYENSGIDLKFIGNIHNVILPQGATSFVKVPKQTYVKDDVTFESPLTDSEIDAILV